LDALWRDAHVNETAVTWSISHARRALGQERGHKAPIETVHGRGYRFVADVRSFDAAPEPVANGGGREALRVTTAVKLPFVGRSELMSQLQAQLLEVQGGAGKLCVLQGEAGIGKTRCATELGFFARGRGFITLVGRSVEGVGAPVFWPWQQVLRGLMQERPDLRAASSATLARLSAAEVAPESDAGAAASRVRLFDDVTQLLLLAARTTPILILFDDTHWADAGTIELLSFAAPEIAQAKIMVVATHREEPNPNNARALSALTRRAQNLPLGYLSPQDIALYIADFTQGGEPSAELCQAVFAATAGNPLFVQETVRTLIADNGQAALRTLSPTAIQPSKLTRDVLRGPLRALEPSALALLSVASVLGEVFELTLLKEVAGLDIDALLDRLDAALQRGFVLAEAPNRYRFQHALVRTILYDDVKPTERVLTHRKAAQLLAQFPDREQRVSEIAIHYYKSLAAGDAGTVSKAAQHAAQAAERMHAFEDASMFYQWALESQALDTGATTRDRAGLLFQAGRAQRWAGREEDARATLETAIHVCSEHGYGDLLVKIARSLRPTYSMSLVPDELVLGALEQALHTAPEGAHPQRISALSQLACIPPIALDLERSKQTSAQALALARERTAGKAGDKLGPSDDGGYSAGKRCLIEALRARLYSLSGPDDIDELLQVCDEIIGLDRPSTDVSWDALTARFAALMYRGDMRSAAATLESVGQLANNLHLVEASWYYERHRAQAALMRGDYAAAEAAASELRSKSVRLGLSYGSLLVKALHIATRAARYGIGTLTTEVDMSGSIWPAQLPKIVASYGVLIASEAGEFERVRGNWDLLVQSDFDDVPKEISYLTTLANCAQVAVRVGDRARAERLYELLSPYPDHNTLDLMLLYSGSVSHYLALLAAATDRDDKVAGHFEAALSMNVRIGQRPQLVRTQCEYARWLSTRPSPHDRERARGYALQALKTSEELGLPYVEALAKQLL
jgi:tetratricopeptide (TPR) repeat protein